MRRLGPVDRAGIGAALTGTVLLTIWRAIRRYERALTKAAGDE